MMKKTIIFILLGVLCLNSCNAKNSNKEITNQADCLCQSEDSVLNIILNLPEVQNLRVSDSKISAIVYPSNDSSVFDVRVGINSELRFQTLFMFAIDKKNCNISVYNQLTGNTFSLEEWQSRYKDYINGNNNAFDVKENDSKNKTEEKRMPLPIDWQTLYYATFVEEDESLPPYIPNGMKIDTINHSSQYQYYSVENNSDLYSYYKNNNLLNVDGHISDVYAKLDYGDSFQCYLVVTGVMDSPTKFKLITFSDKDIISELLIGDIKTLTDRLVFSIDKSLLVTLTKENLKHNQEDNTYTIVNKKNIAIFQVQDDGKIVKVK